MSVDMVLIGMLAMAVVTAACRILPFILPSDSRLIARLAGDHPAVNIVGPALIVALAVATWTQPVLEAVSMTAVLAYAIGAAGTAAAFYLLRNVGGAVVIGIICYGSANWLLPLLT